MFTKLMRLGRDAELRTIPSGEAVCNLSLAYDYGKKGPDGKRATQWVDGSLWGKQAEALQQYLVKGKLVCVTLDDLHIETFQGQNGQGHKLAARVVSIELAGGGEARQAGAPAAQAPAARPAPAPQRQAPAQQSSMPDDDDIPF